MIEQQRENLVLVHSFPTNSNLITGFYKYLGDYFNVYPVDLPGFTRETQSLDEISIPNYAQFVQNQVRNLDLDQYLLGGISFGFSVVNEVKPDDRCKGIIAMEPYINSESLGINHYRQSVYLGLLRLATASGVGQRIWTAPFFPNILGGIIKYPADRVAAMIDQVDSRTFLETARIILENKKPPIFHDLPYALVANPTDGTVNYSHLLSTFQSGVRNLRVVDTRVDHYPSDMSPAYFRERINSGDIHGMIEWFKASYA